MVKDTVVKTFMGSYMDLSKIVSISEVVWETDSYFRDGISFSIQAQLLKQPLVYHFPFSYQDEIILEKNSDAIPPTVKEIQAQVNDLIQQWKAAKQIKQPDTIIQTFFGQYIDLLDIVSISPARFIDRMGSGGYYVGFDIHLQFLEEPIQYERKFEYDEHDRDDYCKTAPGQDGRTPLAVERLQKQVDQLFYQWKRATAVQQ